MVSPPVAQSLACVRCGGAIPLHGLAPRVRCPHCGHDQDIPADRLARLAQYERSAGDLTARIAGEQGQKAQWEQWYGPDGKPRGGYLPSLLVFGGMAAAYGVAMLLYHFDVVDAASLGSVLSVGILGTFVLGMGSYFALVTSRRRRTTGAAPRVGAQCPKCGAPIAFVAGRASERCAHCGSPVVAGTAIMAQAIDAARQDLRHAAMERYRLERTAMARLYRSSAASAVPYIVLGSFLPVTGGSAIAFTVDALTSDHPDTPPEGLAVLWALALLNAGLIGLAVYLRRARKARWRAIADATAARLGGTVWTTATEWVAWLNALWAGPYAVTSLLPGPCFHAITGVAGGFPVAVDVDPVPADSRSGVPRFDVLVAARLPRDADGVPCPADVQQRAHALGFTASSCSAGFVASGRAALPALKRAMPSAAGDAAGAIARVLLEWARRVGAEPPAPIP